MTARLSTIAVETRAGDATAIFAPCSWKDIPGWEGLFQINLAGDVRSLPRTFVTQRSGGRGAKTHRVKGRILRTRTLDGRKWIQLQTKDRGLFTCISVLLMLTFVGPRPEGLEVCHNDGNCANDSINNLRYDTKLANAADRKLHGTHYVGSQTPNATLRESDIPLIRRAIASGETKSAIARRFGLKTIRAITQIKDGLTWRHVQ